MFELFTLNAKWFHIFYDKLKANNILSVLTRHDLIKYNRYVSKNKILAQPVYILLDKHIPKVSIKSADCLLTDTIYKDEKQVRAHRWKEALCWLT